VRGYPNEKVNPGHYETEEQAEAVARSLERHQHDVQPGIIGLGKAGEYIFLTTTTPPCGYRRVSLEQLLRYVVLSPRGSGYYLLLGVVVGDGAAAGAGVRFQVSILFFQTPSVSKTSIADQ
jgi:hypothetical protein